MLKKARGRDDNELRAGEGWGRWDRGWWGAGRGGGPEGPGSGFGPGPAKPQGEFHPRSRTHWSPAAGLAAPGCWQGWASDLWEVVTPTNVTRALGAGAGRGRARWGRAGGCVVWSLNTGAGVGAGMATPSRSE